MVQPSSIDLEVNVVRYDVLKWQLAQAWVPLVVLVGILARNFQTPWTVGAAFALQLIAVVLFVRARSSFGRQKLEVAGGRIKLLGSGQQLTRASVSSWTIHGATARLYSSAQSFKLTVGSGHAQALATALTTAFGPSTQVGSPGTELEFAL